MICDEVCREPREEIEEDNNCDDDRVSLVGLKVVAMDPTEVIVFYDFEDADRGVWREKGDESEDWNGVRDLVSCF